jgi:hypothetical protein
VRARGSALAGGRGGRVTETPGGVIDSGGSHPQRRRHTQTGVTPRGSTVSRAMYTDRETHLRREECRRCSQAKATSDEVGTPLQPRRQGEGRRTAARRARRGGGSPQACAQPRSPKATPAGRGHTDDDPQVDGDLDGLHLLARGLGGGVFEAQHPTRARARAQCRVGCWTAAYG